MQLNSVDDVTEFLILCRVYTSRLVLTPLLNFMNTENKFCPLSVLESLILAYDSMNPQNWVFFLFDFKDSCL